MRTWFAITGTLAADGMERWPVDLVRANGFDDGFTGIARPIQAFPITVSCNGGVVDASDANSVYHWYLSQRTDDTTKQWISMAHASILNSGSVTLSLTALAVSELGLGAATDSLTEDQLTRITKNLHLYVQRKRIAAGGDSAIQWIDIGKYTLNDQ
jgi:hypothetical protein